MQGKACFATCGTTSKAKGFWLVDFKEIFKSIEDIPWLKKVLYNFWAYLKRQRLLDTNGSSRERKGTFIGLKRLWYNF